MATAEINFFMGDSSDFPRQRCFPLNQLQHGSEHLFVARSFHNLKREEEYWYRDEEGEAFLILHTQNFFLWKSALSYQLVFHQPLLLLYSEEYAKKHSLAYRLLLMSARHSLRWNNCWSILEKRELKVLSSNLMYRRWRVVGIRVLFMGPDFFNRKPVNRVRRDRQKKSKYSRNCQFNEKMSHDGPSCAPLFWAFRSFEAQATIGPSRTPSLSRKLKSGDRKP